MYNKFVFNDFVNNGFLYLHFNRSATEICQNNPFLDTFLYIDAFDAAMVKHILA